MKYPPPLFFCTLMTPPQLISDTRLGDFFSVGVLKFLTFDVPADEEEPLQRAEPHEKSSH